MNKLSCIVSNEALTKVIKNNLVIRNPLIRKYAVQPGEQLSILLREGAIDRARWGFSRPTNTESRLLSVDYTKVHLKPSFRMSFRKKRCLVIADSFYIWSQDSPIPERIFDDKNKPLLIPAVLQLSEDINEVAIITRRSRSSFSRIVDSEPVLFSDNQVETWLNEDCSIDDLMLILNSTMPKPLKRSITNNKILVYGFNDRILHEMHKSQPSLF